MCHEAKAWPSRDFTQPAHRISSGLGSVYRAGVQESFTGKVSGMDVCLAKDRETICLSRHIAETRGAFHLLEAVAPPSSVN